jgi:hypothetical protein
MMDIDLFTARRKELTALADEIETSDRPTRVKMIRLRHIRNEMVKLRDQALKQIDASIEEAIEKAKSTNADVSLRPLQEKV